MSSLGDAFANPGPVDGNARFWGAKDGHTVVEMAEFMGCRVAVVRDTLQRLAKQGCLEVVKVRRRGIDGRRAQVPAYRLKQKRSVAA